MSAKQKTKKLPTVTLVALLAVSIVLLVLLGAWLVRELRSGADPSGSGSPSLGSTTTPQATSEIVALVRGYIDDMQKAQTLRIGAADQAVEINLFEAGAPVDYDALARYMQGKGLDSALIGQYRMIIDMQSIPAFTLNTEYIQNKIAELSAKINTGADTNYRIAADKVSIIRGRTHTRIDEAAAYDAVVSALNALSYSGLVFDSFPEAPADPDWTALRALVHKPAVDAKYALNELMLTYVEPHVVGCDIDIELMQAELAAEDWPEKSYPIFAVHPAVTEDNIASMYFKDTLAKSSTSYATSNANRSKNVELGTSRLNGCIILPGQVFSFNNTVGPRTKEEGYEKAIAYIGGEMVDDYGGGICQVSTTLYIAALYSEMRIMERVSHGYTVSYAPMLGMDATVFYGSIDFTFINNTADPILIVATTANRTLTISLMGTKGEPVPGREVKFRAEVLETYVPVIKETVDNSLQPGQRVVDSYGQYGYKARLYKQVYMDGVLTSETVVNNSSYKAYAGKARVGPEPPSTTAPPETTAPPAAP